MPIEISRHQVILALDLEAVTGIIKHGEIASAQPRLEVLDAGAQLLTAGIDLHLDGESELD
jgi:hypothetical protein